MRCYRKILRISYKDHVTNTEVRAKIQQETGPPDDRNETQTAVVWSCFLFIRSGQNHLARHSEREKKTRRTKEEVGRQHQGLDRPGVQQVSQGSGEQGKMEKTGCKIICGALTTLAVKGLMMMMLMIDDDDDGEKSNAKHFPDQNKNTLTQVSCSCSTLSSC